MGIDTGALDAQLIIAYVLNIERIDIHLEGHVTAVSMNDAEKIFQLCARRLQYEPIAYILGKKEFYGAEFVVTKDCLIPRPDTEVVVEKCLSLIPKTMTPLVFDLCTGSGNIAISLLIERRDLLVLASDISKEALLVAEKNAKLHSVADRLFLHHGDLFSPFTDGKKADLIVINPPYIASHEIANLDPSVRNHEPWLALDAGDEFGIAFYRRILASAPNYLNECGYLVMEIGFDQADHLAAIVGKEWHLVEFFKDLAANTRGIVLKKK